MPKPNADRRRPPWLRRKFGGREIASIVAVVVLAALALAVYDPYFDYMSLGYLGVFLIALIGNATIVLPAPVLIVVVAAGAAFDNPFWVGLLAGTGATIGEATGYLAGYSGNRILEHNPRKQRIAAAVQRHGFLYIATLAFIPNPLFDMVGFAAGALHYPWKSFFAAAFIGKTLKMTLFALGGAYSLYFVRSLM